MAKEKQDAAAKKRSAAAKKAAATRKRKATDQTTLTTAIVSTPPTTEASPNTETTSTPSMEITSATATEETDHQPEVSESGQSAEGLSEYKPKQRPLKAAGLDQHAEHTKREAERQAQRDEHNQRTGDVSRSGWHH